MWPELSAQVNRICIGINEICPLSCLAQPGLFGICSRVVVNIANILKYTSSRMYKSLAGVFFVS